MSNATSNLTVTCGACHTTWETWGVCWEEPADMSLEYPGGDWILGRADCPQCEDGSYTLVKTVDNERWDGRDSEALTAGERNQSARGGPKKGPSRPKKSSACHAREAG